jgi:bla regulator protein blaR1
MDALAAKIENQLDLPVVNSTGLLEKYDFSLYWAAESATGSDNSGPNIFSALESELGLKLSPKKASVPLILIDHIDSAPTGN